MSLAKEEEGQPLLAKMDSLLCCTRRRRRIILRRLLACTIGLTVLCLFFFPSVVFSEQIPSPLQYASNFGRRDTDHDSHLSAHHGDGEGDAPQPQIQLHNPFKPKEPEPPKAGKAAAPKAEEYAQASPRRPQQQVQQQQQYQQPVALTDDQNNDEDLEKSLRKLDSLLPDEDIMEHLLSPLPETGGPPLLRDLASRTRKFKEAFKAWEDLHLFMQGDQILRREDVTQRLRRSNLPWPIVQGSIHVYDTFRLYISSFGQRLFPWTMPFYGDHMSLHTSFYNGGRGLVYTGGDRQLHFIETSIKALRKLGCSLPVEILYLGDEDLREENRERLESLPGVLTRDISEQIEDAGWQLKGWAAKPFAILMSTFREVIFIDADALFFVNPEVLFENRKYVETGTLFFKDRNLLPENRRTWLKSILPKPISHHVKKNRMWTGESGHMQDSGVIVVDKWRHFIPLLLTTRLNGPDRDGNKSKGKKGIYEMVYGDKETFWISWELAADLDYAFHDSVAGSMGSLQADDSDKPATKIPEKPKTPAKDDKAKAEKAKAEKDKKKAEDEEDEDDEFYDDEEEEEEEEEEDIEEKGSTVCSAQLLHFDEDGTPLWFNGWIAKTKFDKDSLKAGRVFEGYMKEHRETGRRNPENPWRIKQSNVVCLKGQEYFPFTPEEQETLAMIMSFAQDDD